MNIGLRLVVIGSAWLLFLSLRLASALRLDRVLLMRLGGRRAAGIDHPGMSRDS